MSETFDLEAARAALREAGLQCGAGNDNLAVNFTLLWGLPALAEIARLRAEREWVSVAVSGNPNPGMAPTYLVMDYHGRVTTAAFPRDMLNPPDFPGEWVLLDQGFSSDGFIVTHYMLLPPRPVSS